MFGIGASELVIIGIVLLIAVGPTRLPKLLKAVVGAYRQFRQATRELRASTGIDELLQDEDLRDLRKPLVVPELGTPKKGALAAAKAKSALADKARSLTYTERVQESPPEGVDLAELRHLETRPSEEERAAIRATKEAKQAEADAIIRAKLASLEAKNASTAEEAPPKPPPEPLTEEQIAQRMADKAAAREREQRAIAAKLSAAEAAASARPEGEEA